MMFPSRRSPAPMSADSPRGGDDEPRTDEAGDPPGPIWAVVTGQASGTSRYAWSEVNEGDVPAFAPNLADGFYSTGTADTNGQPAYEINGRTDVPTDGTARVRMWPAGDLTYYLFAAPAGGSVASGESALGSAFSLPGAGFGDTGVSVTLPADGTYLVYGQVTGSLLATMSAGDHVSILAKVNSVNASFVTVVESQVSGVAAVGTATITFRYTGTVGEVLTLYAARVDPLLSAVWTSSALLAGGSASGDTHLGYLRLGP